MQIKKFKDALANHGTSSRRLGSAKGLDESELSALASRGLISRNLVSNSSKDYEMGDLSSKESSKDDSLLGLNEGNAMVFA